MRQLLLCAILFSFICSCATVKEHHVVKQRAGVQLETGVGGVILKIDRTKDLPNVFNRKDVWGGKVDLGFTEIRYIGLTKKGNVVLQRIDKERRSDESVFTRYGVRPGSNGQATANAGVGGSATAINVSSNEPIKPNIQQLPPRVLKIVIDLKEERELLVGKTVITFLEADKYKITYVLNHVKKP